MDEYSSLPNHLAKKTREIDELQFREFILHLKTKVVEHMEAYSLDIFPDSLSPDKNSSMESVSAYMGRHMCRCFLRYIEEAKIELSEPTDQNAKGEE